MVENISSKRIAVLFGGTSMEREISIKSGNAVLRALLSQEYDAYPVDITKEELPEGLNKDVICFIALHGGFGEDGTLQRLLEKKRIYFTGSGYKASRIAMNKLKTKKILMNHKFPVKNFLTFNKYKSEIRDIVDSSLGRITLPLVVKPVNQGSSIGVSIVNSPEDFIGALTEAFRYDDDVIVEEYIRGIEITVPILRDKVLPPIRISPKQVFFSYSAKYQDKETLFSFELLINKKAQETLEESALKLYKLIGCYSFARIDTIYSVEEGKAYILEVNTVPGLTERSLFPLACRKAGIEFPKLCEILIEDAAKRYQE